MAPLTIYRYMSFEHVLDPVILRRIEAFLWAGLASGALSPVIDWVYSLDESPPPTTISSRVCSSARLR